MSETLTQTTDHPLDPLSAEEFSAVTAILRRDRGVGDGWRIACVEMVEPSKAELADYEAGGARPARRALVL
jgi:primary-amine oxidase